ncbi:MAG: hypothetical protein ACFB0B_20640 [Thermonemataceae bacterium]
MILYYAVGGGWGHVVRASAAIYTLRRQAFIQKQQPVLVLYSSSAAAQVAFPEGTTLLKVPDDFQQQIDPYRNWLKHLLKSHKVETLIMDTFPTGIIGEWNFLQAFPSLRLIYLARTLLWQAYLPFLHPIHFHTAFSLELLPDSQQTYLEQHAAARHHLSLIYPQKASSPLPTLPVNSWLVVHSSPPDEIASLVAYAKEIAQLEQVKPYWVLVSPSQISNTVVDQQFAFYPAHLLFTQVQKIITACGYNTMQQTEPFKEKHLFLPFPRRFDDQVWRATLRKRL